MTLILELRCDAHVDAHSTCGRRARAVGTLEAALIEWRRLGWTLAVDGRVAACPDHLHHRLQPGPSPTPPPPAPPTGGGVVTPFRPRP